MLSVVISFNTTGTGTGGGGGGADCSSTTSGAGFITGIVCVETLWT